MKRRLQLLVPVFVGAVLLVAAVALSRSADEPVEASATAEPRVPQVRVAAVTAATAADDPVRFSGTVRSARRARLSFEVAGRLVERSVDIGDRVRAGQVLARLDAVELSNTAAAAEATLAEAQARLDQQTRDRARVDELYAARAATEEEREQAGAAVDSLAAGRDRAAAQLAEARRRRSRAVLTAPYDGVVTEVLAEGGEFLPVGRPVTEVSGDGRLEVEVGVPESMLPAVESLKVEAAVDVVLPFAGAAPGGVTVTGALRSVGRSAGGPGRLYPVVVDLGAAESTGDRIASGMAAEVLLPSLPVGPDGAGDALALPLDAVVNPGGREPAVFVVRSTGGGPVAERVAIDIRGWRGRHVLVTGAGLAPGDRVVVAGQSALTPGGPVELVELMETAGQRGGRS